MRLTGWRPTAVAASAGIVVAVGVFALAGRSVDPPPPGTSFAATAVSAEQDRPQLKQETRKQLGLFQVGKKRVRLSAADAVDGGACLVEADGDGETSSCLSDGLFATRKAELIVSSEGGPTYFDELHVAGVVAPGVRSARLVKTDGTVIELRPNSSGAFAYESSASDLAAQVYPTTVRLFGPSGKLVGTVDFPAAG
jgi:hypothetical protein